ncbi:MAG: type II toxin-antitoxin system RelE/ParE family toxin [Clostridiales bacterium]|nr:type II toxin-antitoxin system RelE/ParE family toxin [Clostridiales bacterium]MDY4655931.1 hypothetical protein [Eubacteriales bacterium]
MLKIEYKNLYVEKLCIDEKFAQRKLPLVAAKALRLLMPILSSCENLAFFMKPENLGYHLEKLKGKHQYEMSLRVKRGENNCGYRMIFECTNTDIKDDYINMTAIRILDINNHKY